MENAIKVFRMHSAEVAGEDGEENGEEETRS